MPYGLDQQLLDQISTVFESYDQVEEAWLYGSRAMGTQKEGSDIDVTLKGSSLNLEILNSIAADLDDLMTPYFFDLSIYKHVENQALKEHIEKRGILLFSRS